MAIEEIVLSVPEEPDRRSKPDAAESSPADVATETFEKAVRAYFKAARARDRFSLMDWLRRRRRERFDTAFKTLVKTMATEASRAVPERRARLEVRTKVYVSMMDLAQAVARDQLAVIRSARSTRRWGLAFATLGMLGIAFTLVANGWVPTG